MRLAGAGEEGVGEDVGYHAEDHEALRRAPGALGFLAGREETLASLDALLAERDLFPRPPSLPAYRRYRRWAIESAALDLALRQAGRSLAAALGREPRPLRFVVSTSLGDPPSIGPVERLLERVPALSFKLDAEPAWDDELVGALAATGRVEVVDFKGAYVGTPVDREADEALYRRVLSALPDAWIEDPHDTPAVRAILAEAGALDRVSPDAPLHSLADLDALAPEPRAVNVKPSRLGSLRELCAVYDRCADRGVRAYGGGQFELGAGRAQVQLLASLFHPDAPNDVAPTAYHRWRDARALPSPPLALAAATPGFRLGVGSPPGAPAPG